MRVFKVLFLYGVLCMQNQVQADVFQSSTLAEIRSNLESGKLTSVDLVQSALAKNREYADSNIFITLDEAGALKTAEEFDLLRAKGNILGPLHGIPFVAKDNIFVAGLPNTAGTPGLNSFVPNQDASVIERMKQAGAIVLGKTNMHELAYGITSNNFRYGPVRNAVNPEYIGGGSSGGTAVAVALGITSIGLGTDTGGSSRIPAALNGVVGFRPTIGRYPTDGLTRISQTRDTVGPMANSVDDIAVLDAVLSNSTPAAVTISLSGLRIGVPKEQFYQGLEPRVKDKTEELLSRLSAAGVELVECDPPEIHLLNEKVGFPIVLYETEQLLIEFLAEYMPGMELDALVDQIESPDVKQVFEIIVNGDISAEMYREALTVYRPRLQQLYRKYFSENSIEAMIFPTTPLAATLIKDSLNDVEISGISMPAFNTFIRNTDPSSNAGIPGLTIPLAVSAKDLPIGIEIDGPEGSDAMLLAIGAEIEALIKGTR